MTIGDGVIDVGGEIDAGGEIGVGGDTGGGGCVLVILGLVAVIGRFTGVGLFAGSSGLSSDNQSSSSFLVSTTPGTRIGEEHLGQTNFCPARFEGALSFFWHFGHAKFRS